MNKEEAKSVLQLRRNRAEYQAAQRKASIIAEDGIYTALLVEHREATQAVMEAIRGGTDIHERQERIRELGQCMEKRLAQLLGEKNLPEDYLAHRYSCPDCADTGRSQDGRPCYCYTALLMEGRPQGVDREPRFDDFDEQIFPTEAQKEKSIALKGMLVEYAKQFGPGSANLFFRGEAGLGKSFLLGATAKAISERGFSVRYLTAYDMLELFKRKHLGGEETIRPLFTVEFLVLDDLGTESMLKNITVEYLLAILNKRSAAQLPTAVATNLSSAQLKEYYGERVVSRLIHHAELIWFQGQDLRRPKNLDT